MLCLYPCYWGGVGPAANSVQENSWLQPKQRNHCYMWRPNRNHTSQTPLHTQIHDTRTPSLLAPSDHVHSITMNQPMHAPTNYWQEARTVYYKAQSFREIALVAILLNWARSILLTYLVSSSSPFLLPSYL